MVKPSRHPNLVAKLTTFSQKQRKEFVSIKLDLKRFSDEAVRASQAANTQTKGCDKLIAEIDQVIKAYATKAGRIGQIEKALNGAAKAKKAQKEEKIDEKALENERQKLIKEADKLVDQMTKLFPQTVLTFKTGAKINTTVKPVS
jgi:DNA repair exonuclease SbcCD ATPase subunit